MAKGATKSGKTASKAKAPGKAEKKTGKLPAAKPGKKAPTEPVFKGPTTKNEMSKGQNPVMLHRRKLTKKELEEFKDVLLERRRTLLGDVEEMEKEAFSDETKTVSTNHLADSSSEQWEQEFTLGRIENETEELKEINRALEKIDNGTYGVCEATGEYIAIERLRAMPYTRITIDARNKFEKEGGGQEYGVYPERGA
ncbi:MAG: TraR/DksA C4-type zinc finger protein [Planctomycetes bacterium]|nr:TraR/DksA C4-type zinc finger protein [Planctomycetota bacterium]